MLKDNINNKIMNTFLISYDLGSPESRSDYTSISKHIKNLYDNWAHPLQSVWIIKSEKDAGEVRNDIKSVLDLNDKLLVVELTNNWGTYNILKEVTDWMKNNM